VGDRSTVKVLERFYAELARGKPIVEALRVAKLASLREGTPPSVWAAFSAVGDPTATVPLRTPASASAAWWVGGGATLVVLLAAAMTRRRRSATA
jgi:MYXO-CTERM domain-containing protein